MLFEASPDSPSRKRRRIDLPSSSIPETPETAISDALLLSLPYYLRLEIIDFSPYRLAVLLIPSAKIFTGRDEEETRVGLIPPDNTNPTPIVLGLSTPDLYASWSWIRDTERPPFPDIRALFSSGGSVPTLPYIRAVFGYFSQDPERKIYLIAKHFCCATGFSHQHPGPVDPLAPIRHPLLRRRWCPISHPLLSLDLETRPGAPFPCPLNINEPDLLPSTPLRLETLDLHGVPIADSAFFSTAFDSLFDRRFLRRATLEGEQTDWTELIDFLGRRCPNFTALGLVGMDLGSEDCLRILEREEDTTVVDHQVNPFFSLPSPVIFGSLTHLSLAEVNVTDRLLENFTSSLLRDSRLSFVYLSDLTGFTRFGLNPFLQRCFENLQSIQMLCHEIDYAALGEALMSVPPFVHLKVLSTYLPAEESEVDDFLKSVVRAFPNTKEFVLCVNPEATPAEKDISPERIRFLLPLKDTLTGISLPPLLRYEQESFNVLAQFPRLRSIDVAVGVRPEHAPRELQSMANRIDVGLLTSFVNATPSLCSVDVCFVGLTEMFAGLPSFFGVAFQSLEELCVQVAAEFHKGAMKGILEDVIETVDLHQASLQLLTLEAALDKEEVMYQRNEGSEWQ